MQAYQRAFIQFVIATGALRFGSFTLKSGRHSPYFFNAGLFSTGSSLRALSGFYADALATSNIQFDMLFGPAYKGIPLAAATAMALAETHRRDLPFAYNRKEIKDHGEGGMIVGAPLAGRIMIIDDVITAGTSVRESLDIIDRGGATATGVVIALDRCERGQGDKSAVEEVRERYGIETLSIVSLHDVIAYLESDSDDRHALEALKHHRDRFASITSAPTS